MLYAHHKSLDYFSTECIYSPEAFRGSARALIKNLERVRPSAILDVVKSGEDMAKLVPGSDEGCGGTCASNIPTAEEEEGGCGSAQGKTTDRDMESMEKQLSLNEAATENGLEVEITSGAISGQSHHRSAVPLRGNKKGKKYKDDISTPKKASKQVMGRCKRCGYLSSQEICKACVLLEGLNKSRPKTGIELGYDTQEKEAAGIRGVTNGMEKASIADGVD